MSEATSICPGCGLSLPATEEGLDDRYNASVACRRLYDELSAYTLSLQDVSFIHQYVVDAYAAQHSGGPVRPITTVFALVGLYLAYERGYTGRQVQRAHMALARQRKAWPRLTPPQQKAALTVLDVIESPPGDARNEMIRRWARSVWDVWQAERQWIAELVAWASL